MESKVVLGIVEDNFDRYTFENSLLSIVMFSANRCSVCKALAPVVEEIAVEYTDKLKVYSVNVDENESLAVRFRLMGIPTLLFFKDGEVKERISGFHPKEALTGRINHILMEDEG